MAYIDDLREMADRGDPTCSYSHGDVHYLLRRQDRMATLLKTLVTGDSWDWSEAAAEARTYFEEAGQ